MDTWTARNREKREKLLQALPEHGWDIAKAGLAAGYAKQYALHQLKRVIRNDIPFCNRILAKRAEITASSLNEIETVQRKLDEIINDKTTTVANRIRCLDIKCKILGVYSEKRVIEDVTRQRELDQAEQAEASLLATLRLRLPAPGVTFSLPNIIDAVTQQADIRAGVSRTEPDMQANSIETGAKQGDSSSADTHMQALLTDGQDGAGEGLHPPDGLGASFPCSPR